ncbi:ATP-binding cassette domain-containing protein [Nocardioides sp. HM23]|uniref:ABC transporter ATP-binding protein n=1 Tax=Nocardioides bizhenqiangii TaxID=3095076 RepID=UPI002ACABB7A|nr:ATP-binding cassette domain-containing protein [Nocardioides sp. HM23]MDZ5621769.1 ATP-binding cassette domain-containing protein [Nocardioides sp. HM23]
MTESMLTIDQITVRHRGALLVDAGDVTIRPGRPTTIIGESGSGKSLLAHAVMGTIPTELDVRGSLRVGGRHFDAADLDSRRALWGRELALLPQEPAQALDPTMRVRGQVAEGVPGFRSRDRRAGEVADAALGRLGLARAGRAFPHQLSGGMAQRVAFAATTVGGARILIVDEPTKGLDPVALDQLATLLTEHCAAGGALLTITHDLRLARQLGGDVLVMRDATIVERGAAVDVLGRPAHDYTRRLLAAEPGRWHYPWMRSAPPARTTEPLVTATGLTKGYGAHPLFTDLSLTVHAGERWAVNGPSGVGKTTLGNLLLRLGRPDRGHVEHGPALEPGRVQKLYQDPASSFPPRVPLRAAVDDVLLRHRVRPDRLRSLLDRVGLPEELLDRRPSQVSGGELQRLAIVRAMLPGPKLLLADEATSRLDLVTQAATTDCLMAELAERDCALLLVTHDRDLAGAVADHLLDLTPRAGGADAPAPAAQALSSPTV